MTEKLLEKILKTNEQIMKNSLPKKSMQLIVSSDKTDFFITYSPPLELDDNDYEIALIDLETYYSFSNVENKVFKYFNGTKWVQFNIPDGSYEIRSLNKYIQSKLTDKEAIELLPNRSTLKTIIKIKEGYKVSFESDNTLKDILGFNKKTLDAGTHNSDNIANILDVNTILVHLNIITGSYVNGNREPVIHSFFPKVSPGYKIVERPKNLIYLPVAMKTIKYLHVKITDQNDKLIHLRGETITIKFHMRQI